MESSNASAKPIELAARVLIGLCAVLGAALTLWITAPFGPGVDSDSAQYLAAAESAARGAGWIGVDGAPYTLWPPLFPSLIAALTSVGLGAEAAVRWLHAVCALLVIAGAAGLVWRLTHASVAAVACAVLLVAAPALFSSTAMIWSEAVFLALLIAAAHAWLNYDQSPSRARFVVLASLSAAIVLQRYLGITWIAAMALELLCSPDGTKIARRARRSALFVAAAVVPIALWFVRNAIVTGALDGKRGPPTGRLAHELARASEIPARWLGGYFDAPTFALIAVVPLALFGASLLAEDRRQRAPARFVVLYLVAVITLRHAIEFDDLDERLLVPLLPFLAVALCIGAVVLGQRLARPKLVLATAATWLALCTFGSARELYQRAKAWRGDGVGLYETTRWRNSALIAWLREHRGADAWLTNEPFAFFCALRDHATPLPVRPQGFTKLHDRLPPEPATFSVAWFTLNERAVLPLETLSAHFAVERTHTFVDGEVYVLSRK